MTTVQTESQKMDDALMRAVRAGDVPSLKAAIAAGASVEASEKQGKTALFIATELGLTECVRVLVEAGARVNRRVVEPFNKSERTPLNQACRNTEWALAEYLLENGADPRITNDLHETPANILLKFLTQDPDQLEPEETDHLTVLFEKLMTAGNPPNQTTAEGVTLLKMLTELLTRNKGRDDLNPLFDVLLKHGGDPNKPSNDGRSPMQRLWTEHNLLVLEKLIAAGGDLNARDAEGASVLRYADDVLALTVMIDHGGDIHHTDDMEQNVLLRQLRDEGLSISDDLEQRLALLIDRGADPYQKDLTDECFMDVLERNGKEPAKRLMALYGAKTAREAILNVVSTRRSQPNA